MARTEKKILIADLETTLYHLPAEEEGVREGRGVELMLVDPWEGRAFLSPKEAITLSLYLRSWAQAMGCDVEQEEEDTVRKGVCEALLRVVLAETP